MILEVLETSGILDHSSLQFIFEGMAFCFQNVLSVSLASCFHVLNPAVQNRLRFLSSIVLRTYIIYMSVPHPMCHYDQLPYLNSVYVSSMMCNVYCQLALPVQ